MIPKVGKIEGSGISMSFDYGYVTLHQSKIIPEEGRTILIIDEFNEGIRKQLVIAKNRQAANNTSIHIFLIGNSGKYYSTIFKILDYQFDRIPTRKKLVIKNYLPISIKHKDKLFAQSIKFQARYRPKGGHLT